MNGVSRVRLGYDAEWRIIRLIAMASLAAVSGCGGMRPVPLFTTHQAPIENGLPVVARDDLLNEISMYHGVPYKEGGDSMKGLDCSGLVQVVFAPLGVKVPRTVVEQFGSGIPVGRHDVRTGDLVFFGGGRLPDHVGIAVSDDEMVHASASRGVILDGIDNFAGTTRLQGARRLVRLR